ncbi:MAG: ATP-binding cassette domain-containing protein [Gammaproteobacteria bacterium]|nr:ATP-binding cassette domain-containing protein [Gammaproteobacteria bacterium]MCP5423902.1 ATP-binding cassette domain-containing protein [Gammaproteobacteria bacterium]
MPASQPILPLALRNVDYEIRGARLLENISLALETGPRTVVMGPNGAGKSLLLRICHGLLQPSRGSLQWANPIMEQVRHAQAMVFQRTVMLRRSTAANIAYALAAYRVPRSQRNAIIAEVLEQAGLAHLAYRSARVLSGGEQQRLALARAWAVKPQVLFLDEPTANLDPAATHAMEEMIGRIHGTGTKIVMTTHDLGQARRLADEVFFLHRGRLLEQAPARSFFAGPQCAEAAAFLEGKLLW